MERIEWRNKLQLTPVSFLISQYSTNRLKYKIENSTKWRYLSIYLLISIYQSESVHIYLYVSVHIYLSIYLLKMCSYLL